MITGCTFVYLMCVLHCIGPLGLLEASKRLSVNECRTYREVWDKEKRKQEVKDQIRLEELKAFNNKKKQEENP